jgi:hypothetical protein
MAGQTAHGGWKQVVVFKRPEVCEIELGLVEALEQLRNEKGEAELDEHHGRRADDLIAVMPVLHEHADAEHENGERIQETVEEPAIGRTSGQRMG